MAAKRGKKCGNSHIPQGHKCSKGQAESASLDRKKVAKLAAMTGLAVVGGVVAYKVFKNKISDQEADQIISEAVAGKKKWGPFEALKRKNKARCEGRSDGRTVSRCRLGGGAYGDYYVHTSEKYGVKVQKDSGTEIEFLTKYEATIQDKANQSGANVPAVLSVRGNKVVMEHLKGYETVEDYTGTSSSWVAGRNLSTESRRDFIRNMKALHIAEIAHGDLHDSNVMIHPQTKKMAIIDWGYATAAGEGSNPTNGRSPLSNLKRELDSMSRRHLNLSKDFSVTDNFTSLPPETRAVAIKNLYTQIERQFEKEVNNFVPRSRLISNNSPVQQSMDLELSAASLKAATGAFGGNKNPAPPMGTRTRKWLKEGIDIENPAKPPREAGILTRMLEVMPTPNKAKPTGSVTNMQRKVNAIVATGFNADNPPSRTPGGKNKIRWPKSALPKNKRNKTPEPGTDTKAWAKQALGSLTPATAKPKTWNPPGTHTINRDRRKKGLPDLSSDFIRRYRRTSGGGPIPKTTDGLGLRSGFG